jgi:hypothetical protein
MEIIDHNDSPWGQPWFGFMDWLRVEKSPNSVHWFLLPSGYDIASLPWKISIFNR